MRLKKLFLLVIVLVVICVFPVTATANAPEPLPYEHEVLIDDYQNVKSIEIILYTDNGSTEINFSGGGRVKGVDFTIKGFNTTRNPGEKTFKIENTEGKYDSFQLIITLKNDKVLTSNKIDFIEWSDYKYCIKDNTIRAGGIKSRDPGEFTKFLWIIALLIPLGITLAVESIASVPFKIKPLKYVVIINLLSNLTMNVIIILIFRNYYLNYFIVILILELIVLGVEYLFYTYKYKYISRRRLLLFTFTANVLSWGAYALFNNMF